MFIFVSWPAQPGDYIYIKQNGKIRFVEKAEYGGVVMFDDYYPHDYKCLEKDDYYVLHKVHNEETPLEVLPEIRIVMTK